MDGLEITLKEAEFQKLSPKPGDIIIFHLPANNFTEFQREQFSKVMKRLLPVSTQFLVHGFHEKIEISYISYPNQEEDR